MKKASLLRRLQKAEARIRVLELRVIPAVEAQPLVAKHTVTDADDLAEITSKRIQDEGAKFQAKMYAENVKLYTKLSAIQTIQH